MKTELPTPPRFLPAYGINSKDICREHSMPEDFYGAYEDANRVNYKYRTAEYEAAAEAENRVAPLQGINGPTIRRNARLRTEAAFKEVVRLARELNNLPS